MPPVITEKERKLIDTVLILLGGFQHIPVHNEIGIPKESVVGKRDVITFAYDNWNTDKRKWFHLNNGQRELREGTDFTLDATAGEMGLLTSGDSAFATDGELPVGQQIEASYHFKYYSDEEILICLEIALNFLNMERPVTQYATLDAAPAEFFGGLIIYGYYCALKKILMDNQIWNNHLIWATNADGNMQGFHGQVYQLKEEAWREWAEQKKMAKPRSFAKPRGVHSGKFATQQRVTGANFQQFTIIGGSL